MEISVLFFGALTDITGTSTSRISIPDVADTDSLEGLLKKQFPRLGEVTYRVAVDRRIIQEKTCLAGHSEVALLPPFSGG